MDKTDIIFGPKRSSKVDLAKKIASNFKNNEVFWCDAQRFITKNTHPFSHIDVTMETKLIIIDNVNYEVPDYKLKELTSAELLVNKPGQEEFSIRPQYIFIYNDYISPGWIDPALCRRFTVHYLDPLPPAN